MPPGRALGVGGSMPRYLPSLPPHPDDDPRKWRELTTPPAFADGAMAAIASSPLSRAARRACAYVVRCEGHVRDVSIPLAIMAEDLATTVDRLRVTLLEAVEADWLRVGPDDGDLTPMAFYAGTAAQRGAAW